MVLVTNPKNAQFLSGLENIKALQTATHVRFLFFSDALMEEVKITIDSAIIYHKKYENSAGKSGFYSVPWNNADYQSGIHQFRISVKDRMNRESVEEFSFSLDGTFVDLKIFSHFLLTLKYNYLFPIYFVFIYLFFNFSFLFILRINKNRIKLKNGFFQFMAKKSVSFRDHFPVIFCVLFLFWLAMIFLPWCGGQLATENIFGFSFIFGTFFMYPVAQHSYAFDFVYSLDNFLFFNFQIIYFVAHFSIFWFFSSYFGDSLDTRPAVSGNKGGNSSFDISSNRKRAALFALLYISSVYLIYCSCSIIYYIYIRFGWFSLICSPLLIWYNAFIALALIYFNLYFIIISLRK